MKTRARRLAKNTENLLDFEFFIVENVKMLFCGGYQQVVKIDLLLTLRRHCVNSRSTVSVWHCMGNFQCPVGRLRGILLPSLGSNHARAVSQNVNPCLKAIPDVRLDLERNGMPEPIVVGKNLQLLAVSDESENISLIDQSDI